MNKEAAMEWHPGLLPGKVQILAKCGDTVWSDKAMGAGNNFPLPPNSNKCQKQEDATFLSAHTLRHRTKSLKLEATKVVPLN